MESLSKDNSVNKFSSVYRVVQKIPKGKVTTYGDIAKSLGYRDVRIVGWALNKNPDQINIPCHRVVNKQGKVSKAFAFGGANKQVSLLKSEGVEFIEEGVVDLRKHLFSSLSFTCYISLI